MDRQLAIFKEFFNVLFKSDVEMHIFKSNINICNSPLRTFSINRKN